MDIFEAPINRKEKSRALGICAAQMNRVEKKDKTVSFLFTNKQSFMVKKFVLTDFLKKYCLKILQNYVNVCFKNEMRYRTWYIC